MAGFYDSLPDEKRLVRLNARARPKLSSVTSLGLQHMDGQTSASAARRSRVLLARQREGRFVASRAKGEIRKNLDRGRLVDCMVAAGEALPTDQIPACLWFLGHQAAPARGPDPSTPASSDGWSTAPTAS